MAIINNRYLIHRNILHLCMLFTWNLYTFDFTLIYLHFYEHEKVAAYSDGHVRVFELLDPLELTNWQLQVKLDCSTFSELKNAVHKILHIINQHVFLFCSLFVGWISKSCWISVFIWKGSVPLCVYIFESPKVW